MIRQAGLLVNITMLNMCLSNEKCRECKFYSKGYYSTCRLRTWYERIVYTSMPENIMNAVDETCDLNYCDEGCPLSYNEKCSIGVPIEKLLKYRKEYAR